MKTIVIADIHQRTQSVEAVLKENKEYDKIIFLGDWFDSFHNPPTVTSFRDTCHFLKSLVTDHPNKNKFVFLLGNHDVSYIYHNNASSKEEVLNRNAYFCSGFTIEKAKIFREEFFDKGFKDEFFHENFKLAHQCQGFTLSHAGLHPDYVPTREGINKVVDEILPDVWKNFRNQRHPRNVVLSGAGYARGGNVPIGGLIWLDWHMEYKTTEEIGKQIVGHTQVREPEGRNLNKDTESWNIDTTRDYGIILNGRFTTKEVKLPKTKTKKLSSRVTKLSDLNEWINYLELKQ
jgi:hypothetical protein